MWKTEFRGKRWDTKQWMYGGYYYDDNNDDHRMVDGGGGDQRVIFETIGQFTGLKDENGKYIFHGDIVKDTHGNIGVVKYSENFLDWRIHFYKGRSDLTENKDHGDRIFQWTYIKMQLEVIGNRWDNPELLTEG
jgi:uncharacterized phage protein (TIGR01671 family)